MTQETSASTEATPQEQPQAPGLSVQDLVTIRNIIDTASRRGAFHANEFTTVGNVYTKLSQFLEAVTVKNETEGTTEE